ncbi:threonylcarbamoyl-AMP synthase [Candidatus Micrarchaeota archaeon]|nr:threonylcarbamoyl-AMP synthase [Candidatus Micrarchaeota archaeon]
MKKLSFGKILSLTPEIRRNRTLAAKIVDEAADVLAQGGIIIMPTETSYGISVDATNDEAVRKVFEVKQRPAERALPILVSDKYMIEEYAEISELAKHLMDAFMPGPLSLVVPMKPNCGLAKSLSAKGVSFRIPSSDVGRAIVAELDKPITTTSANISGTDPLYTIEDVKAIFRDKVNLIIDGGDLQNRPPSTVLDLQGVEPKILRHGPIVDKEIFNVIEEFKGSAVVAPA